jgi:hypothetical protein
MKPRRCTKCDEWMTDNGTVYYCECGHEEIRPVYTYSWGELP